MIFLHYKAKYVKNQDPRNIFTVLFDLTPNCYIIGHMRNTIKNHNDFLMADDAPTARCGYFLIRAQNTRFQDGARYGLTATKKTFRLAVQRNRAKRLLRDWIAFNEKLLVPEFDYVFIARRGILDATREEGREAMRKALRYIQREFTPNKKPPKNVTE